MAKRRPRTQSKKSRAGKTHDDTLEKTESTTSGTKTKRATKRHSRVKNASKKKSHAKKTNRTGRKAAGRKAAHEEHSQTQAYEPVNNSYE